MVKHFSYSMIGTKEFISLGYEEEIFRLLESTVWKTTIGEYVRSLVESNDMQLRVFGLRIVSNKRRSDEAVRNIRRYVVPTKVRNCLKANDALERYWACLAAGYLDYRENADLLREMFDNHNMVNPHDPTVGIEVRDAAIQVLDVLAPSSIIRRKQWQRSFRKGEGNG